MTAPLEVVAIGAGSRGTYAYAPYANEHPDQLRFVAVAEPIAERRERFAQLYNVPRENCFASWEDIAARPQLAEAAFNCTQDAMHTVSTLALLKTGYHMLLEKPMATTPEECVALAQAAEAAGRTLQICHVLRFTSFFSKLHEILTSGRLGEIVTVEHRENVVFWHMAHSFVRGNWRNSVESSPMILAKCCHDLDILFWNLGPARRLSSFGSLFQFRPENAPQGATLRCTEGCPAAETCQFDARKIYLRPEITGWPVSTLAVDTSLESRQRALETGPYGRCVYHCDNDVVDNQTVSMELASGATCTMFMHGHSHQEGRSMRYDGTRATLRAKFIHGDSEIEIYDHLTGRVETISPEAGHGHGGGDYGMAKSFVESLRGGQAGLTSARNSLESHMMAFAAEKARLSGSVIPMADYKASFEH